ncbi:hypothetical protein FKP32DRAFT_1666937 [Trametes sanguinea]|nr:hypothetical protein FKP32DRAFT_1666937 [Trametes sanguinea]
MAFPIPSHLPRKKDACDVSTQILTKVSETSLKDLSARTASTWVWELDETIKLTKKRIHDRISDDLPDFQRQYDTAVSVQERLRSLSQNVDVVDERISDPQSGLVPNLLTNLRSHSALAQETADARARHDALAHLLRCRDELRQLTRLVEEGELPRATEAHATLQDTLRDAPEALQRSEVLTDVKRRSAALGNRTAEQLLQAYSRSIVVSTTEVVVRPSVQVPQSTSTFPLSSIIASMTPAALATHVSTLRRDILAHCVEYVLKQPVTISEANSNDLSGPVEHRLTLYPAPPGEHDLTIRLDRLTTIMAFLHEHLFPHFPAPERKSLALSLTTPLRTAILNHLLLPHLPSSLPRLPDYLALANRAVQAEDNIAVSLLGDTSGERSVRSWVESVGLHYERKRRAEILDRARIVVTGPEDLAKSFRAETTLNLEEAAPAVPVEEQPPSTNGAAHGDKANGNGNGLDMNGLDEAENGWDFEEEATVQSEESFGDGWGFDDEVEPKVPPEPPVQEQPQRSETNNSQIADEAAEEDADDAWGWNDDTTATAVEEETVEESPWDDPWDEKPSEPEPEPVVSSPPSAPKPAKGLQKFSKSAPSSPSLPPPTSTSRSQTQPAQHAPARSAPQQPTISALPKPVQVTETYLVSGRTKDVLQLLEDVLREGTELVASGVLHANASGSPGNVIMQAAPMALELFRALVPVVNAAVLQQSPKEAMRFANDCRFVAQELEHIISRLTGAKAVVRDKLEEALGSLKLLADSWFEDSIAREERVIEESLDRARGFIDTTHQERYDECEDSVNEALQRIRRVAPQWKAVLAKSKYYEALGALVETAVSRVLGDVLALEDITEVESHRLSELCRILHALEGLFVEDPDQPSFVVSYVPSWLKFSYLSELLEASIADISYLFEEGALVDFEIDELVKLVRALFADTPLRANTINRLLQA